MKTLKFLVTITPGETTRFLISPKAIRAWIHSGTFSALARNTDGEIPEVAVTLEDRGCCDETAATKELKRRVGLKPASAVNPQ